MDIRTLLHAHRWVPRWLQGWLSRCPAGTLMSQGKASASSGQHGHGAASLAVDGGYTDCTWGHQQTTHTTHRNSGYNWWRVDLGVRPATLGLVPERVAGLSGRALCEDIPTH